MEMTHCHQAVQLGVKSVVLFPKTPDELKTQTAEVTLFAELLGEVVSKVHGKSL